MKPVRLRCTATGVDIGYGWGLYVSAQDNDLSLDRINPGAEPWEGSPLPSPDAVLAARTVLRAVASGHLTLGPAPTPGGPSECGRRIAGSVPSWAGEDQIDPCVCVRPHGHGGFCRCDHLVPAGGTS